MSSIVTLPDQGVVFWSVGNGDSTTVVVDRSENIVIQVDLNHTAASEADDDERTAVVDALTELLDTDDNDRPYLAVFALTHPDQDHCRGFDKLLEDVTIGELWLTPRSFLDADEDSLSEDAEAFYEEALRRVNLAKDNGADLAAGDRVRLVGYSSVLETEVFEGFPEELLTNPGEFIEVIDGNDALDDRIEVFVHSPFRADTDESDRNSSALGMQVTTIDGECRWRTLLLGDLAHETIEAVFERSEDNDNTDRLEWDLLLAPHHCSKHAVIDSDNDSEADAADFLRTYAADNAYVAASCNEFRSSDSEGDDPPHLDARDIYEDIVDADRFIATVEHAADNDGDPIVFDTSDSVCGLAESRTAKAAKWRSIGAVTSGEAIEPGEKDVRGGDRPYA